MTTSQPIGIFDSGIGGLSVLREIRRELPHEDLVYAADSGHAPYGDKPAAFIEARAEAIVAFLREQGAKAIVVACNTATGVSVDGLRARWSSMPIVGIEPAIKPAVAATRTGVVGVLATSQTIASSRFARLVAAFGSGVTIVPQACPGLVERIETGDLTGPDTRALVDAYVTPLVRRGADTLVLGCTHYPFVAPLIGEMAGEGVAIVDPSAAVARELRRHLDASGLRTSSSGDGRIRFWTSGPPDHLQDVARRLGIAASSVDAMPV